MKSSILLRSTAILVYCLTVFANAAIDQSNFIAPTAASPYRSPSNGRQRAILPYSLYQRRLEEQNKLREKPKLTSTATNRQQTNDELLDESNRAVLVYLPAFKNANQSQIADEEADAAQRRREMLQRFNGSESVINNEIDAVSSNHDFGSQEKSAYSTSNSRQPLSYHKSIFRPKTTQIVTVNEPRFQPNQSNQNPIIKSNPKPMSEKLMEPNVPERPANQQTSLRKNMFINGVPLESSNFNQIIQPSQAIGNNPALTEQPYQPRPMYSNLAPAPYNTLSSDASSQNLIESIFSQSQTPVRFSPANAGLAQPVAAQAPLNPLQALANTANSLGGQEMLSQFLGGGGSPLEQISKLARNLLSLPSGNPEILSALTKTLATNTVAEGSKLTSNAVVQPASLANVLAGSVDKAAGLALGPAETLFSSAKDEENSNATLKMLSNLPEDQRNLLAAAIQNGEIDETKLNPTFSSLVKDKSILKSENRLIEWIQENRPRAAERETKEGASIGSAERLPYYGRYCGSFVETNSSRHYNIAGALWAVDDTRLIVSKFHFKPGARTENITFWFGPANITGSPSDIFPTDNGFYAQPQPIDLNTFMNQQVEVITAKIRSQLKKDEPSVAAELEEMEEEHDKNVTTNEVKRSRREAKTVAPMLPLHFEASKNETDKSVHLTVTSPNMDTTTLPTSTPISTDNIDQSHILISSTNNEVSVGKEATAAKNPPSNNALTPLDWYAGFQPLLLTLPEGRSVKTLHWLSIYDHKRKESAATVLIPNGIAFQIPAIVQLRPLTPNSGYKVSSGAVKVLDTKTIEIENFSLDTNMPVWFLVGKEIVPTREGQIVTVFDRTEKTFDCDSLRNYANETVTLRLPGTMDIKDVFWISVFSITKSISLSHFYVPYDDIRVPTDLLGVPTPRCVWKQEP